MKGSELHSKLTRILGALVQKYSAAGYSGQKQSGTSKDRRLAYTSATKADSDPIKESIFRQGF